MSEKRQIGFGDIYPPKVLKKYINQILKTRRFSYGPITKKLEEEFVKYTGNKYAVFCSSGTMALFAALGVLKNLNEEIAKKKPYIILPAVNFVSDVNIIHYNGFQPIFVDVGSNFNISYSDLESKLKTHQKEIFAVIPVSLMGRPVDGVRIKELVKGYCPEAFILLDSCENLYSKYDKQFPEKHAEFTAYSTYLAHLLVGGSCGGFITTDSEKYAIHARSFINHGRDAGYLSIDADNNVEKATLKDITAKRFSFVQHGINGRMDELNAAVALSMLEDDFIGKLNARKNNAEFLIRELSKFECKMPSFSEKEEARHMMLPIMFYKGKDALVEHLENNGIETRPILPMWQKITEKYFGNFLKFKTDFPMAANIYENGFYISCHNYLTQDDLDYMVKTFESFFEK